MSKWKRDYRGRYISQKTGWIVERSCEGGWVVINPVTMQIADRLRTKREAISAYE